METPEPLEAWALAGAEAAVRQAASKAAAGSRMNSGSPGACAVGRVSWSGRDGVSDSCLAVAESSIVLCPTGGRMGVRRRPCNSSMVSAQVMGIAPASRPTRSL